jgi:AraC-like DNA-binding protein
MAFSTLALPGIPGLADRSDMQSPVTTADAFPFRIAPYLEHIVTAASESFLWRLDDYPREHSVWNVHPEYELHLIRRSSGISFVGDHVGEFHPGYLALVGGDLPHDWVTIQQPGETIGGRDIVVQFSGDRIKEAAAVLPELSDLQSLLRLSRQGMVFKGRGAERGAALLEQMGATQGLSRLCLFLESLDVLSNSDDYDIVSSKDFAPDLDTGTMRCLQGVLSFLLSSFTQDIRLPDAAHVADMNESAFSRFFKKNMGNSFTDYLTRLRLCQAGMLLAQTALPITDICFESGYANVANFNRRFLEAYRITPSTYRRLARHRKVMPQIGA